MERPKETYEVPKRAVTGEIAYLDSRRRIGELPGIYEDQSDMAIQMYEQEADMYADSGSRPGIMDEYQVYDEAIVGTIGSCVALADELLALQPGCRFVDIRVTSHPDEVLRLLHALRAGSVLANDDQLLTRESNPSLDARVGATKRDLRLSGVSLRVRGDDDRKVAYTNASSEAYNMNKHALVFPSDERNHCREFEVMFAYGDGDQLTLIEIVRMVVTTLGNAGIGRSIFMPRYAEMGYGGHGGVSLPDCTDYDLAEFGDLVARIVGDEPEAL